MKKFFIIIISFLIVCAGTIKADEGMWIPLLLKKYNIKDMQAMGFKLTADDIYSINQASMKDAVMIFGGGCTGELVSDKGLILTNHHCGFGWIQYHSTLESDYLTNGFWAMNNKEELVNPGLSVTFLVRMEDVSTQVLKGVTDDMIEIKREKTIAGNIKKIAKKATEGTHYKAIIKPFYFGNEYYMFVNEVYTDVRLVGAPPSAIGKFGGDTDNWMWPRHTGDFSVFRIYADKNNKPADYSVDNVPFKPKKHFPISMKGVKKNDFTMVFGYPGSTQQYLTSHAISLITKTMNPHKINIRQKRIDVISADMDSDPSIRLKYASKYAGISNAWKKWQGENRGLRRLNAIKKKKELEKQFQNWTLKDPYKAKKYGKIISKYKSLYKRISPYQLAENYIFEAAFGIEILRFSGKFRKLVLATDREVGDDDLTKIKEQLKIEVERFFKDYNQPTDQRLFAILLKLYYENVDKDFHIEAFRTIRTEYDKSFGKYGKFIYSKSMFANKKKLLKFIDNYTVEAVEEIRTDPAYNLYNSFVKIYLEEITEAKSMLSGKIDRLNRTYINGLREMQTDKIFYPDANFTLRVAYGKVDDYEPRDGVRYRHYTTLEGIIEKDNPDIYDYRVPEKLKELYENKDYGEYAENGELHVAFTATNHTTGGNSGSPVINGSGHLIGINFDRNWEGTMSDIMYDPTQCRNITLDIRYALFIIDKFAGAGYLLDEMTLIK